MRTGAVTAAVPAAAGAAAAAREQVWALVDSGAQAVVVDSPPGAGKSTLVRDVAARLAADGEQIPVVVQTNDQGDDLAYALARHLAPTGALVGRWHSADWTAPASVPPGLVPARSLRALEHCAVVVATAAKWAYAPSDTRWTLGIVDEAYQMSSAALVRVADRFARLLLVGDPGQLAPFTVADEQVVRRVAQWPLDTAAGTVLRHHPDTPVVPLPVSWRLPPTAAAVVADAFYTRGFQAGAAEGVRQMTFEVSPMPDEMGRALTVAAVHGWSLLALPPAFLPHTDPEMVEAVAGTVVRLLASAPVVTDEHGTRPLTADRVAVGVAHRDQRALVRTALARHGLSEVVVDTANRLQGREFDVTVAWHPLSGRRDASSFHLEAGRLCVLASRHRQACLVVTRAGVAGQLDAYPATEPVWLGADPPQVDGWEANRLFLERLSDYTVASDG